MSQTNEQGEQVEESVNGGKTGCYVTCYKRTLSEVCIAVGAHEIAG